MIGDTRYPPTTYPDKKSSTSNKLGSGVSVPNGSGFDITSKSVNWLLSLLDDNSTNVPTGFKEQNNSGLEALGEIASKGDNSNPMDDGINNFEKDAVKATDPKSNPSVTDDSSSTDEPDDASKDNDKPNETDPETENPNVENVDNPSENDDGANLGTSSPDGLSDNSINGTDSNHDGDISQDPYLSLNRRTLISDKVMELYDRIKTSMDIIANGPSFDNKPVMLESLGRLADDVNSINSSINKEPDHQVILLKYAVCVKVYSKIINQ